MSSIKEKFRGFALSRGLGYFLTVPVIILAIVSIVMYNINCLNAYCTEYNYAVYICFGVGIAIAVLSLFVEFIPVKWSFELVKPLRAVAYLLFLFAALQYVMTQITLIGAIVAAIDTEIYGPLAPGFISTLVVMIVAALVALVSTCLNFWQPWNKSVKIGRSVGSLEEK